jgi:hypothetical protein
LFQSAVQHTPAKVERPAVIERLTVFERELLSVDQHAQPQPVWRRDQFWNGRPSFRSNEQSRHIGPGPGKPRGLFQRSPHAEEAVAYGESGLHLVLQGRLIAILVKKPGRVGGWCQEIID